MQNGLPKNTEANEKERHDKKEKTGGEIHSALMGCIDPGKWYNHKSQTFKKNWRKGI